MLRLGMAEHPREGQCQTPRRLTQSPRARNAWDRGGRLLKGKRRRRPPAREQDVDLSLDQLARQGRQPVKLTLGLAVDERHGLSLAEALLAERAAKGIERRTDTSRRTEHADVRLARPRLRERVVWPQVDGRRDTGSSCDDLPLPHSITSSGRARRVGEIVRSSALAVLRLMIIWNLVGCVIGRSPGRAPFRMRSTYSAARRHSANNSTP